VEIDARIMRYFICDPGQHELATRQCTIPPRHTMAHVNSTPMSAPPVPLFLVTRFARGRLLLWMTLTTMAALLEPRVLFDLPRSVFAIWAGWIAASALLVVALEYILPPRRRHWLDALQASIDLPVIALITWHTGTVVYLIAPCLAIPLVSASGWLPRRFAAQVAGTAALTIVAIIALVASGTSVPRGVAPSDPGAASRTAMVMVLVMHAASLGVITWLQFVAVDSARDRRARWQRLFDGAPDSIFVLDRAGIVQRLNSAAQRITGYTEQEIRGKRLSSFSVADDRERAMLHVNRALHGETTSFEARAMRADGTMAHVLVSNAPLVEKNEINGVLCIVHDVTEMRRSERERRQIEQSLDQHRRLLQSIVATIPTYLYVLDLRRRQLTFANEGLLHMLGRSLEQIWQMPRAEIFTNMYHPDDVAVIRRGVQMLRNAAGEKLDITYRLKDRNGEWRWLSDRCTVFERDADGSVTRLLGSAIDITEQKRVSAQLRSSDELYRTLIENYPGGAVLLFDQNVQLLLAAGRGLREAGIDAHELVGKPMGATLDADAMSLVQARCRAALSGIEQQFELVFGKQVYDVRAVPVRDDEGVVRFGMALTLDVTERRRLEAEVRQSQKMEAVGTLAGGIAHDFNNILASVIGYAELAMLDAESEGVQADLHQVLTAAARGRQMVQRILAFSRRSGDELQPVELAAIVDETLRLLRPTLPPGVSVDFAHDDRAPAVLGDGSQLHQVVLNLCGNAIYAMRTTGGLLTVRLHRLDRSGTRWIQLVVSDTGTGMSPEVLERAIDPFFTTKPPDEGTGMGLAMVHGIITGMGGTLRLESVAGEGTAVFVELPADSGRRTPTEALSASASIPVGHERIMIVDDEQAVAAFLNSALTRLGYRTSTYTSAEVALQVIESRTESYDLLITDMTMPRYSGEAMLRASLGAHPGIPVVMCTGYSASMSPERATELGAAGYITKPVSISELATQIRRLLDRAAATVVATPR
jgi:PAS domain S-box-containing protein